MTLIRRNGLSKNHPGGGCPMVWQQFFLNPAVVWILLPITYIIVNGIQVLCRQYYEHQERLAMIQQGMVPPDRAKEDEACA